MSAIVKPRYTLEEYFELERTSEEKYEYFNGEVFCMSGTTRNHSLIAGNILAALKSALRGQGCEVHGPDLRVRTPGLPPYRYPDVSVVCGPMVRAAEDPLAVVNPALLAEVTSDSTEDYDRGEKLRHYQHLASVREILLVSHREPRLTLYARQESGWSVVEATRGEEVTLDSVGVRLAVDEIYRAGLEDTPAS